MMVKFDLPGPMAFLCNCSNKKIAGNEAVFLFL